MTVSAAKFVAGRRALRGDENRAGGPDGADRSGGQHTVRFRLLAHSSANKARTRIMDTARGEVLKGFVTVTIKQGAWVECLSTADAQAALKICMRHEKKAVDMGSSSTMGEQIRQGNNR